MKKNNTVLSVILLAAIMVFALACSNPAGIGPGQAVAVDATDEEPTYSIRTPATEYYSDGNYLKVTFSDFDGTFSDDTLLVCVTNIASWKILGETTGELHIEVEGNGPFQISWPVVSSDWTSAPYLWSDGLDETYLDPGESCGFYIRGIAPGTTELKIFVKKSQYGVTIPVTYN
jgi:hypothetical protein